MIQFKENSNLSSIQINICVKIQIWEYLGAAVFNLVNGKKRVDVSVLREPRRLRKIKI